jgi:short-subunit dehydrogenase
LDLKDKNVILTGATSGIGYALAKKLAKEKCNLAIVSRRVEILEDLAGELRKFGKDIYVVKCDVSKKKDVKEAIAIIKNKLGKVDIAIFNSGISYRGAADGTEDKYEQIIKVNLLGLIYCVEEVLEDFKNNKDGIIAGVSSLADSRGYPFSSYYSASKAAATKYLESLRVELKPYNVKILTIKPGFVRTPMTDKNEFYMPFLMEVDKAADIILKGIKKEKTVIQFPFPIVLGSKILGIIPNKLYDFLMSKQLPAKKSY